MKKETLQKKDDNAESKLALKKKRRSWSLVAVYTLVTLLVLFTCVSLFLRTTVSYLDSHPEVIQSWLEKSWQAKVALGDFSMASSGKTIAIEIHDFSVRNGEEPPFIATKYLYVEIDWWKSLRELSLQANQISLKQPELWVTQHSDGHLSIGNKIALARQKGDGRLTRWFLQQKNINMQNAKVWFYSENMAKTWQASHASVQIHTTGRKHVLVMKSQFSEIIDEKIGNVLLEMEWQGDITRQWDGKLKITDSQLPLKALGMTNIRKYASTPHGFAKVDGQFRWKDNRLQDAKLEVALESLTFKNVHTQDTYFVPDFVIKTTVSTKKDILHATVETVLPPLPHHKGFTLSGDVEYEREQLHVRIPNLQFSQIGYFSPLLADKKMQAKIAAMQVQGEVKDVLFNIALPKKGESVDTRSIQASGSLQDVNFLRSGKVPGVKHFSGKVRVETHVLNIDVDSQNVQVDFGDLFRDPMHLGKVKGKVALQWLGDKKWEVSSDKITVIQPFATAHVKFQAHAIPDQKKPFITLSGDFQGTDLRQIKNYLPVKKMKPKLVAWLDQAFNVGEVSDGKISLHGDLNSYPFSNKEEGEFFLSLHAKDASLRFHKDWQALSSVEGDLEIRQQSLQFVASKANLSGVQAKKVVVKVDDLRAKPAVLEINAQLGGKAKKIQTLLKRSPLQKTVAKTLAHLNLTGNVQSNLDMRFLLKSTKKKILPQIKGTVILQNNTAYIQSLSLPIKQISGQLNFTENSVESVGLLGQSLGGKIKGSLHTIVPLTKTSGKVKLKLSGVAQTLTLKAWAPMMLPISGGSVAWQGEVIFRKDSKNSANFTSGLNNTRVVLPDLVTKPKGKKLKMSAKIDWTGKKSSVTFKLGAVLQGQLFKSKASSVWTGGIAANGAKLKKSSQSIMLSAKMKTLDLVKWQEWLAQQKQKKQGQVKEKSLVIDVQAATVLLGKSRYSNVNIKAKYKQKSWLVKLFSSRMSGELKIPDNLSKPINIHLNVFKQQASKNITQVTETSFIERPVNLKVDALFLEKHNAGSLILSLKPNALGVEIKNIRLEGKGYNLKGSGRWLKNKNKTDLTLKLKGNRLQKVLQNFSYTGSIYKAPIDSKIHLSWAGNPSNFALEKLSGKVDLHIGAGILNDIDASSGKVFGLMGLHTIKRRLKGDTKDLTKTGLDFDSVKGVFTIKNGVATTIKTSLASSTVHITFKGSTNLYSQIMDFNLDLRPRIADSLPAVGAMTAGIPGAIIGGAVAVFDKITNHGVDKAARKRYRLKGTWKNPKVIKIKKVRKTVESDDSGFDELLQVR